MAITAFWRQWRITESPGAKLIIVLIVASLIGSLAIATVLAGIITPGFDRLERSSVNAHVGRTQAVLAQLTAQMENTVRDYGDSNFSYAAMAKPDRAFAEESVTTLTLSNLNLNGMAYVGDDASIVVARWIDPATQADQPAMRQLLAQAIGRIDLVRVLGQRRSAVFYARLGPVVAIMGVARLRRSDGSGEPRGHVVLARALSSHQLSALLQLPVRLEASNLANRETIAPGGADIEVAVPISGIDRRAAGNVILAVPRDTAVLGQQLLSRAITASFTLLAVLLVITQQLIARLVLHPLYRVERHLQTANEAGTPALLNEGDRRDLIGAPVGPINAMLRQLREERKQPETQRPALKHRETAGSVMDDMRDALNPISTVLSRGTADQPPAEPALVERAIAQLAGNDVPPERRHKLAAFLGAVIEAEATDRAERRRQLQTGREAMQQVLAIIATDQRS